MSGAAKIQPLRDRLINLVESMSPFGAPENWSEVGTLLAFDAVANNISPEDPYYDLLELRRLVVAAPEVLDITTPKRGEDGQIERATHRKIVIDANAAISLAFGYADALGDLVRRAKYAGVRFSRDDARTAA